jgi:hypothetical protein
MKVSVGSEMARNATKINFRHPKWPPAGVNPDRFERLFVSFKPGHKGDLVKMTIWLD